MQTVAMWQAVLFYSNVLAKWQVSCATCGPILYPPVDSDVDSANAR